MPNPLLCSCLLCVPRQKHKLLVSRPVPIFLFSSVFFILLSPYHLCLQPSTFHLLFFLSHPSPPVSFFLFAALHASPSLILFLSHSIVNFNLRAGLNGTIRERSMLLIWMPAHLDLSVPHQRRKKKSLFSSSGKHISQRAHIVYKHTYNNHAHISQRSLIKDLNARDSKYLCSFKVRQSQ